MSFARRSLQVMALLGTLLVGAASMAVIVTQTTWFKEWLRTLIVRQAGQYLNGELSIGRLGGNLFFGVEIDDVEVRMDGRPVIQIGDVGLDYSAFTLIRGDIVLNDLRLNRPVVRMERTADGWNVARLLRVRTPDPDAPPAARTIEMGEIVVSDGTVHIEGDRGIAGVELPSRVERFDALLGVRSDEHELRVNVDRLSFRTVDPAVGVNQLSGVIRRTADGVELDGVSVNMEESALEITGTIDIVEGASPIVDVRATSDGLVLQEIGRLVPAVRTYHLQPAFDVHATGPADRLSVTLDVTEPEAGRIAGMVTVEALEPGRRVAGAVSVDELNIGPLVARPQEAGATGTALTSDITGQARFDLTLPSEDAPLTGTYAVDAIRARVAGYEARNLVAEGRIDGETIRLDARALAYGGQATARGTVRAGAPLQLDLTGRASNLDLRNLPPALGAPGVSSTLAFDYTLKGRDDVFSGDVRFERSILAGASIAPGTVGRFTIGDGAPRYAATGEVSGLDVQQVGRGFGIEALSDARYQSDVHATFDVSGSGGGQDPLVLDVTGTIVDSDLLGAHVPRLDLATQLAGGDLQVQAAGRVEGLDPAAISGNDDLAGSVDAGLDIQATIRGFRDGVGPDDVDAAGRVTIDRSTVGGLTIDSGAIAGAYARGVGQVDELDIQGVELTVQGSGTIGLADTAQSNLTVHLETPSLERIGELIDQELQGGVIVDATITGNARELSAEGSLQGSNLGFRNIEALAFTSDFSVTLPDLSLAGARIQASSTATFLEIGGQSITELTADTVYAAPRLEFDAVAREGVRELRVAGEATLEPDRQQVRFTDLGLQAEDVTWQLEEGTEANIDYGGERVGVDNLRLASEGGQRIEIAGAFGVPGEALRVSVDNVDVAELDRLVLGDERLSGRLTAEGTVSGTADAPRVSAMFTLAPGAFRAFTFQRFVGSVDYDGPGVDVDVRLEETPEHWVTITGYAPMALFRPSPPDTVHIDPPPAGEAVDLTIASSQIDLGVIQGFTPLVTDVSGTLQANVAVTGTGDDPHFVGGVDIIGGALTIPELGTTYTGIETRIDLEEDLVRVQDMRILDRNQRLLMLGGTLAVHDRSLGEFDVVARADSFQVIDNLLAEIAVDAEVRLSGQLRAPRIEGYVELDAGTVNVAEVLEQTSSRPIEVGPEPVDPLEPPPPSPDAAVAEPAEPSEDPAFFDAVNISVGVSIPNNLLLRGNDIRPAGAPVALGDANVTVGGLLQVEKTPGSPLHVNGEVNTVRGTYTFQGRRFEILRQGRIRFTGGDEIDPLLDIRARRIISGVEAFIGVEGTMRQPELTFSSNPPLDQADVLSLIVFNMPLNELGEGQQVSLAERAGALAGGYLASGLTRSLGRVIGLDEFEIQARGDAGGGPRVIIGERIGNNLFVRIEQGFGAEQATELSMEYQIGEFLRLTGYIAESPGGAQRVSFRRVERSGIDLVFFFSY